MFLNNGDFLEFFYLTKGNFEKERKMLSINGNFEKERKMLSINGKFRSQPKNKRLPEKLFFERLLITMSKRVQSYSYLANESNALTIIGLV